MADASHLIAIVPKNAREELRVRIDEYQGHTYVDLRLFADMGGDEPVPTKKGVTIPPTRLAAIRDALDSAEAELRRRGALAG